MTELILLRVFDFTLGSFLTEWQLAPAEGWRPPQLEFVIPKQDMTHEFWRLCNIFDRQMFGYASGDEEEDMLKYLTEPKQLQSARLVGQQKRPRINIINGTVVDQIFEFYLSA